MRSDGLPTSPPPDPERSTRLGRLTRVLAGHAQAIDRMVDERCDCIDVLKQIAAVRGMLATLADEVSEIHLKGCVRAAIEDQRPDAERKIDELMETVKYLRRL